MNHKKKIRVLIVDDSADDRELILMHLRRGGYDPDYHFAETKEEMMKALDERKWDLILCDYSMPGFDGLTAIKLVKERKRDIPFILISGAIGEELAVEAMKTGAHDYLMKDNLQRLIPAIERELNEAIVRRQHKEAEKERDRLLKVIQHSLNEVYLFDKNTLTYNYVNSASLNNLGYSKEEITQMTPLDIKPVLDKQKLQKLLQPLVDGEQEKITFTTRHSRKDNTTYPVELHLQLIEQDNYQFFAAIGIDQTDRKKDAQKIKQHKQVAEELALHSKYKSEFLANMSHELRTPLNSINLLSKLLSNNQQGTLTEKQLEYIDVIHQSGNNLLELINEVLDLSKIEAGEMEIHFEEVKPEQIVRTLKNTFSPLASEKNISFIINVAKNVEPVLKTDKMRVEQILKNLLSNAFKFTSEGSIELSIYQPDADELREVGMDRHKCVGFCVKDTGIGIPDDKQELIFENFRQVDGSTQRKYGGTGLGLSICNQLSQILGGCINLISKEGEGSSFTLYLPENCEQKYEQNKQFAPTNSSKKTHSENSPPSTPQEFLNKNSDLEPNNTPASSHDNFNDEKLILIATQDAEAAETLSDIAEKKEVKTWILEDGERVHEHAKKYKPAAILIDSVIPGWSGWTVAKKLKRSAKTCHIPIWILSTAKPHSLEDTLPEVQGYFRKPLSVKAATNFLDQASKQENKSTSKNLLLVDDNEMHNEALKDFTEHLVDQCYTAGSSKEAFKILESHQVDCIVLDMTLTDANGLDVLRSLKSDQKYAHIPVIIYTGRNMSNSEEQKLLEYAHAVIFKNVGSYNQLTDEISTLLGGREDIQQKQEEATDLYGKKVLVVDDDPGSFFSISSVLESNQINVISASNGLDALKALKANPDTDAVLMDIMMPDMNGFEVIREIRENQNWKELPVITVTAKAMSGDREKCLESGATDYISKPLDADKLIALLQVWL